MAVKKYILYFINQNKLNLNEIFYVKNHGATKFWFDTDYSLKSNFSYVATDYVLLELLKETTEIEKTQPKQFNRADE